LALGNIPAYSGPLALTSFQLIPRLWR
jgi:hypothetical protein